MFSVTIKDHIMIAHSLPSDAFGPAQNLHGATYVISATFSAPQLDENNIVIDIDIAHKVLKKAIEPLKYKNLDDLEIFKGKLTTTEFLAHHIHASIGKAIPTFKGKLKVTLGESHVASAAYEGDLPV